MRDEPKPLRDKRPEVPPDGLLVAMKTMRFEKEPGDRFANIEAASPEARCCRSAPPGHGARGSREKPGQ